MSKYINKEQALKAISKCHYISDALAAVRIMDTASGTCAGCWHYADGDSICYRCSRFYEDRDIEWEAE